MASGQKRHQGRSGAKKGVTTGALTSACFMDARQSDQTAPCHYAQFKVNPNCQLRVTSHQILSWTIKMPISSLSTREQIMDPTNLSGMLQKLQYLKREQIRMKIS